MGPKRFSVISTLCQALNRRCNHRRTYRETRIRKLLTEQLERRDLLTSDWQNPLLYADVNDDCVVAPIDVLQVINQLRQNSHSTPVDLSKPVGDKPYFDTNGDGELSAIDVLLVINFLSRRSDDFSVDVRLQNDTGESSHDFVTNDSKITGAISTGNASATTVKARINRGPIMDIPIGVDGKFLFAQTAADGIADGNLNVKFVVDKAGVKRAAKLQFTLDTVPPAISDPKLIQADDTGIRNDDNITQNTRPHIVITAEGNARVKLKADDTLVYDGLAPDSAIQPNQPWSDGLRQLSAIATDLAGNTTTSQLIPLVVDTVSPKIAKINLHNGDVKLLQDFSLNIDFEGAVNPSSLVASAFKLTGPSGVLIPSKAIKVIDADSVRVEYQFDSAGSHKLSIDALNIADPSGNLLGTSAMDIPFNVDNKSGSLFPGEWFEIGSRPLSTTVGDFDGDNISDLATANNSGKSISILIGKGDGTFKPQQSIDLGLSPQFVTVGDFNEDGRLDLAAATGMSGPFDNPQSLLILIGKGDGTFTLQQSIAFESVPKSIIVGDFNDDGRIDLVVPLSGASVIVLIGKGDGTFIDSGKTNSAGSNYGSVSAGDFNRDGRLDLVITDAASSDLHVMIRISKGDGTFSGISQSFSGSRATSVTVGDFNGDGYLDLATTNEQARVSILTGKGDGTFVKRDSISVGNSPISIKTDDLNGDGLLDLAIANVYDQNISILIGKGDGTFQDQQRFNVGASIISIAIGDFNGDGRQDLATTTESASVSILTGNGDGTFNDLKRVSAGLNRPTVNVGDFNGDGRLDLASVSSTAVSIVNGKGDGTFNDPQSFAVDSLPFLSAIGDFNGDGRLDLITAGSSGLSILIGKGDGTFHDPQKFSVGLSVSSLVVGDFNDDGRLDIAAKDSSNPYLSILLGKGDGTFNAPKTAIVGSYKLELAVGDFNGDGRLDIVHAASASNLLFDVEVFILIGKGDGTFAPQHRVALEGASLKSVAIGDFNGDKRLDLAITDFYGVSILIGKGDGTFNAQKRFVAGQNPNNVVVGDFNGDGRLDLVTGAPSLSDHISILIGKGDGTFNEQHGFVVGLGPSQITVGDFNGDGWLDLANPNPSASSVSILLNQWSGKVGNASS